MFKNFFKKNIKTVISGTDTSPKDTIKIKSQFAFLSDLEKCLQQGCRLSHLSFVDDEQLQMFGNATKQLIQISQSLKQQQLENNQMKSFYQNNRHVVSNHTSIVKGIETMYQERIALIRDDYSKIIQQKQQQLTITQREIKTLRQNHTKIQSQFSLLQKIYEQAVEYNRKVLADKQNLERQIQSLRKQIQLYNSATTHSAIRVETLNSKDVVAILLRSEVSFHILNFLNVAEILELSKTNKVSHYIVQNSVSINRFMMKKAFEETERWREETTKQIKCFESMVENINDDSIRQSALKYIYFHQKPGQYILGTLKQFNPEEQKQEKKRKGSLSIFGGLLDKEKKQEGRLNLKQLADPDYFKKVEGKIEQYFQKTIDMKNTESLKLFRDTMLEQYEDLKKVLLNENQILRLYHCAKFIYLQSQELHRFSQYLFSLLVQLSKKNQFLKSEYEDMFEREQSIKNALQIISSEKTKIQEQNWLLEYDLKKQKLDLQNTHKQLEQTIKQNLEIKENHEKLKVYSNSVNKKSQDLIKKVNKLEKYMETIRSLIQ